VFVAEETRDRCIGRVVPGNNKEEKGNADELGITIAVNFGVNLAASTRARARARSDTPIIFVALGIAMTY